MSVENAPWNTTETDVQASDLALTGETPDLHTAVQIKEDSGLVGEDYSFLVVFTTAVGGGGAVCMHGLSQSGKDAIVDAVESCLKDNVLFKVPERGTESSIFREENKWNSARIHRHKDLVNLEPIIEDILKHHGSGDSITRTISMPDGEGGHVPTPFTLHPPDCLIYFLATDNEQVNLNNFPELRNRSLVIPTDASQSLTEEIQYRQAQDRGLAYDRHHTNEEVQAFQEHVASLPVGKWDVGGGDNPDFYHPFWETFEDQHPIPSLFVESRKDSDRFLDFVEIMSVWHHKDRMAVPIEYHGYNKERMLCTPADLWYAMRIYGEKLVLSALSLGELDKRILWFLREKKKAFTVSSISQVLGQAGFNVTPRDVRGSCDNMVNKNYLTKDDSATIEYQATPFAVEVEPYEPIDWQLIIDGAKEDAYRVLTDDVADEYVEAYCGEVTCRHPVTGDVVDITDYQGFQTEIKQREEDLQQMLGTSIYGNSAVDEGQKAGDETESSTDSAKSDGDSGKTIGGMDLNDF